MVFKSNKCRNFEVITYKVFLYVNCVKKGTLEIRETHFTFLVLKQSPLSTIFAIVRILGGAKFILSEDPCIFSKPLSISKQKSFVY